MVPQSLLQVFSLLFPTLLHSILAHGQATPQYKTNPGVFTDDNILYYTNIHVGGEKFRVQVDTGSTDLYVKPQGRHLRYTNTTSLKAAETYGSGNASGPIMFSDLHLGSIVVPSQAFLEVESDDMPSLDGLMGFAFDLASIHHALVDAWGNDSALALGKGPGTNTFAYNPALPPFFDLRLERADVVAGTQGAGDFYIGSHSPDYEKVADAPKLWRTGSKLHWDVVLDGMKINGQPFAFNKSNAAGVPQGKAVAVLDSGCSLAELPAAAVEAIYASIPGAVYSDSQGAYLVPCNASTNLTFTFAGVDVPVHPADISLTQVLSANTTGWGKDYTFCTGGFNKLNLPFAVDGFDMILGDAFLRNVYASFNYGAQISNVNAQDNLNPYVQMLPTTTDIASAWDEFSASRALAYSMANVLSPDELIQMLESSSGAQDNSTTSGSSTPSADGDAAVSGALSTDDDSTKPGSSSDSNKYGLAAGVGLLAANLAIGLILLGVTLTMCTRNVKSRNAARYAPVPFREVVGKDPEQGTSRYSDTQ